MEQQSKRTASAGASRVDNLLGLLSVLSQDDPPPALRGRLELLSSRRWRREVESGEVARQSAAWISAAVRARPYRSCAHRHWDDRSSLSPSRTFAAEN